MDALFHILWFVALVFLLTVLLNRKKGKEETPDASEPEAQQGPENDDARPEEENKKMQAMETTNDNKPMATRDLLLDTLTKIGCQYQLGEGDDDRIYFAFQGENFAADAANGTPFIRIWDLFWEHVELYDVEEVSRMKRAINATNINTMVTTLYSVNKESKGLDVHCKHHFLFIPQIPQIDNYLRAQLADFFHAHQLVGAEMAKMRKEEGR